MNIGKLKEEIEACKVEIQAKHAYLKGLESALKILSEDKTEEIVDHIRKNGPSGLQGHVFWV